MAELKIRVGAAVGTDFTTVFRPLVRAAKDARRQVQEELNSLSPNRRVAYGFYKELVDGARQARRVIEDILGDIRFGGVGGGIGTGRTPYSPAVNAARAAVNEQREAARRADRERREQERQEARRRRQQERDNERYGRVLNRLSGVGVQIAGLDGVRQKFEDLAKSAKEGLDLRTLAAEAERELNRVGRAAARAALGLDDSKQPRRNFAYRMGYWAMQNFSPTVPMLSVGRRVMSDIAGGAGLRLDIGGMVASHVSAEQLATQISASGYDPYATEGPNARRVDPRELMAQASEIANTIAMSPNAVLEGLDTFTALSGDLQLGRDLLLELGTIARATGASFEDIMAAAGNAANVIEDGADKAEILRATMAAAAGQGKLGAVEIKDMAVQMAGLAAAASQYSGSSQENIVLMGAIAQEARQRGGAKSAAQAATAVGSLTATFTKGARVQAFQDAGIAVHGADGKIRNIEEIILESLARTGGDSVAMGKLFSEANARRGVLGFEAIYREAGGGQAGLKAVSAEFERLKKAAMSSTEIQESFARSLETLEARSQLFQNAMGDIVSGMADRVLPRLLEMQPQAERLMLAFADIVAWAVDNPFKAVAAALGASIAKAGIEQVIRVGIEDVFSGYSRAAGMAGGVGVLGNLTAGLVIASVAVTAMRVGMMEIDNMIDKKVERERASMAADIEAGNVSRKARAEIERTGRLSPEMRAELQAALQAARASLELEKRGGDKGLLEKIVAGASYIVSPEARERDTAAYVERYVNLDKSIRELERMLGGTLRVEVVNQAVPAPAAPSVQDLPRTGPGN